MNFTDKFNNISNDKGEELLQISPDREFYKIDDFTVTQDTEKVDVDSSIKTLKDLWGKGLPKYINKMSEYFEDDIPIVTMEEYLREMKDICAGKSLKAKRFSVRLNNAVRIDSVIILNKYKDHYVLMNEIYQNEEFKKAAEYNFNELLKHISKY